MIEMGHVLLHFSYEDQFNHLDDQQLGVLIRKVMAYAKTGSPKIPSDEYTEEDPLVTMAFSFIKGNIDREQGAYTRRVRASRENGRKGGRPKSGEQDMD